MSPTRRTLLKGLAALPAAPAVAGAAAIMPDPTFALIEAHRAAYAALNAALCSPALDDAPEEDAAEAALRDELASTPPTSLAGLRVYAEYMAAYDRRTGDWETAQAVLATLAEACRLLIGGAA